MTEQRRLITLAVIGGIAFGARLSVRLARGEANFWEQSYGFYFDLAQKLVNEHTFCLDALSCAYWTPLYPAFLALATGGARRFEAVAVAQSLVGAGTALCAYGLARRWFDARAGLIAAALTALYPYFVVHDTALQETGLYTLAVAAATLVLDAVSSARRPVWAAALAGGLTGLAMLVRPSLAPFVPLALGWLWFAMRSTPAAVWWKTLGGYAAAVCVVLAPWLLRNTLVVGRPTLTTRIGHSLWIGNNPQTFSHYPQGSIDRSTEAAWAALTPTELAEVKQAVARGETALDDWFRARALAFVRAHPGRTLAAAGRKLGAAFWWRLNPVKGWREQLVYGGGYVPVMLLALGGAWRLARRRRWSPLVLCGAHVVAFGLTTAVFWAHTSHRSYLDVYFIVLAGGALSALCQGNQRADHQST
ncbi:MAG: glycosyltransferase family 39 protein [Chloracidobacterium sp.]|nr:glycosyltransferase family 39 protein [Chloracidobacterium sp.]MDW8216382.1 glycosyltransferase family 39 protein [Acidobacteriota bacterium]